MRQNILNALEALGGERVLLKLNKGARANIIAGHLRLLHGYTCEARYLETAEYHPLKVRVLSETACVLNVSTPVINQFTNKRGAYCLVITNLQK